MGGDTLSNYGRESESAEFLVENLRGGEARQVSVLRADRGLGRVVDVRPGDDADGPVVIELQPTATIVGLVVDPGGRPVAGAVVEPRLLPSRDFGLELPRVATDDEGRFRVPDVPPGTDYQLAVRQHRPDRGDRMAWGEARVLPGEATDVGEIRFDRD